MGSITIQAQTAQGTLTRTFSVSDTNVNRLAAWAQTAFWGLQDPTEPPLTKAEGFNRWAQSLIDETRDKVQATERANTAVSSFTAT